ncbi:reverse transcriptase domain-containing protein [Tanacetum coccineum]
MAGPVEEGGPEGTDDQERTPPPLTKEQIEGHVSALKSLIKSHNRKNKGDPIRLDFETEDTEVQDHNIAKGKEVVDEDLRKPFNADNSGEWPMPMWCRMFQQTLDGSARGWFERLPHDNINEWAELREAFAARYSVRRACFKEPHEITKIIRKANESLTTFKERWAVETGFIMGVPEVMKISSFMDSVKSPELAKRFSDKVPTTVNEMMERLDDFANTELPKGEAGETHRKMSLPFNGRDVRPFRSTRPGESRRDDYRYSYRGRDAYRANRARDHRAPYLPLMGEYNRRVAPILTLYSLTKHPKEILAIEMQLRLLVPRPILNLLRSGNNDRYCDYHQEKGHYINDCIQLRKQLEMALESGKLNHLVKDVRQMGRGSHGRDEPQPAKIINVISVNSVKDKKRKVREATESWMNILISFPAISSKDVSEEPLIVEAEVEGYLVRRVYVDEGSSVEVMFEHCFENLNPKIKAKLKETQTDLVGFAGEISKPLGKIELEVCFGNGGLYRRTSMKFIVVRAPSPYNIILGRPGLKTLRAIPSIIHSMMKFPTPKGVATLVTRTVIIAECRRLENKQMIEEESPKGKGEVAVTEEVLVNPSFLDQLVTIGEGCPKRVPWRIIEHALNVNPSLVLYAMKRDIFNGKKLGVNKQRWPSGLKRKVRPGYHQIQMAKWNEEKRVFYTDQGTYCYTKMPFGLKNAGATYQRLVDSTFQSQIGRNLKAYVDDMVIKSRDEKMVLADISETFDNLKKISMKLNPKKCSFEVEEGKFLGYMVTSEGIRANPRKTKALADL